MKYFPFALDLKGKNVLVVGGGKIAERKAVALFNAGAFVEIVSPSVTDVLKELISKSQMRWKQKKIEESDIDGICLIISATDDMVVNKNVSKWSKEKNVWINVVDQPLLSDFISPAVFSPEEGIIAVYSDGQDPVLSRDLKNFVKEKWNEFLSYRDKL